MACPYCKSESWIGVSGYEEAWTNGTRLFGSLIARCQICEREFLVVRVMDEAFWEEHYPVPETTGDWLAVMDNMNERFRGGN